MPIAQNLDAFHRITKKLLPVLLLLLLSAFGDNVMSIQPAMIPGIFSYIQKIIIAYSPCTYTTMRCVTERSELHTTSNRPNTTHLLEHCQILQPFALECCPPKTCMPHTFYYNHSNFLPLKIRWIPLKNRGCTAVFPFPTSTRIKSIQSKYKRLRSSSPSTWSYPAQFCIRKSISSCPLTCIGRITLILSLEISI